MNLPKTLSFVRGGQPVAGTVTRVTAEVALGDGRRVFKTLSDEDLSPATVQISTPSWSINQKFEFMTSLIGMVVNEVTCSGGLGKTRSVLDALAAAGLNDGVDYQMLKGYTTPKGFYEFLYRNNGKLIVVDDCDSVFNTDTGINILKGALDSYDSRVICWQARETRETREGDGGDSVPMSFEFTGRVIFISNLSADDVPQPIRSRSINIDLTMSVQERLDRIEFLLPALARNEGLSLTAAREAFTVLVENKDVIADINIRTAIMTFRIRKSADANSWKSLAVFQLVHN
jgi:hypothetical protein